MIDAATPLIIQSRLNQDMTAISRRNDSNLTLIMTWQINLFATRFWRVNSEDIRWEWREMESVAAREVCHHCGHH